MKKFYKLLVVLAALAPALGGCIEKSLPPSTVAPICKALIGPIKYNSTVPGSKRFAAALLAMDLKERNQVGQNLGCPLYK